MTTRNALRPWISAFMALAFLFVGVTGIFMLLHVRRVGEIHEWSGILFLLLAAAHLFYNWRALITSLKRWPIAAAALALLAIFGVALFLETNAGEHHHERHGAPARESR